MRRRHTLFSMPTASAFLGERAAFLPLASGNRLALASDALSRWLGALHSQERDVPPQLSLPELVDFKLFGQTILVVNKQFKLFLASQLGVTPHHLPWSFRPTSNLQPTESLTHHQRAPRAQPEAAF